MEERKNNGNLSLNVNELLILHLISKINLILQHKILLCIIRLILVFISRDNFPQYIYQAFLGTKPTKGFGACALRLKII